MRKFAYILLAMLMGTGCSYNDSGISGDITNPPSGGGDNGGGEVPEGDGPTQPLKRRPIVPNGKIQRPRFRITLINTDLVVSPEACNTQAMTISVRCEATGFEHRIYGATETDELTIPCDELRGEVAITTEIDGDIEIEYFILAEK